MSGGFFRGTSADQDTRFSNKKAKLLKSQKFAPELEHLVDMTKVNMDVMRPWIAKRVTELIGIEDEVLINFIYGLLEGKEVNGKEVQISLTGFMERNTGKFMKELWSLLLSAQKNESGVPQQLLDEKLEDLKKKKAETDRIANEIHRKKEREKKDLEGTKVDGDSGMARAKHGELEPHLKHGSRGNDIQHVDDKEKYNRNGPRGHKRGSLSPDSASRLASPRRRPSASPSKSLSNSRNHSPRRSRSISEEPSSRSRSVSPERRRRAPPRRSASPRQRRVIQSPSPPRRRPSLSRHRSTSRSRRRTPSPARYRVRSTWRYRSRTPIRRRSRTPVRYRSRSPVGCRSPSPVRRRSPSPVRRGSPSPVRRRSPQAVLRRMPSPIRRRYRRSPSTPRQQSISPVRRRPSRHCRKGSLTPDLRRSSSPLSNSLSPTRHSSPSPTPRSSPSLAHRQSPSPIRRSSPPMRRRSLSPVRRGLPKRRSPLRSPGERIRSRDKSSPVRRASPSESTELPSKNLRGSRAAEQRPVVSLRSPQRDTLDYDELRGKLGDSSPPRTSGAVERFSSRDIRENKHVSSEKIPPLQVIDKDSPDPTELHSHNVAKSRKAQLSSSDKEHRHLELSAVRETTDGVEKGRESHVDDVEKLKDKNRVSTGDGKGSHQYPGSETLPKPSRKSEHNGHNGSLDSPPKEADDRRNKSRGKRKHKKSEKWELESDDYSSYDSYEERKEAKRRRKEEKKLKKEERRLRREDRRRRKEEKRAEKLKYKSIDTSSSSDNSEDESVRRRGPRVRDIEETESEQKKLEIQLREKALESLRAKKGIGN